MELDQFLSSIDWSRVKRIHTSRNGNFSSFSVEVGKKRHVVTIGIGPGTTTLTVSDSKGHILVHAVQHAGQMMFYAPKPGTTSVFTDNLDLLGPVRIYSQPAEGGGPSEPGV